jgi:hypothetical protein
MIAKVVTTGQAVVQHACPTSAALVPVRSAKRAAACLRGQGRTSAHRATAATATAAPLVLHIHATKATTRMGANVLPICAARVLVVTIAKSAKANLRGQRTTSAHRATAVPVSAGPDVIPTRAAQVVDLSAIRAPADLRGQRTTSATRAIAATRSVGPSALPLHIHVPQALTQVVRLAAAHLSGQRRIIANLVIVLTR